MINQKMICKNFDMMHPTQPSISKMEAQHKIDKMIKMSKKELVKYLKKKEIPVIIGPNNKFYLIDRHHLLYALWELKISHFWVKIIADYSNDTLSNFLIRLKANNWVYLVDNNGKEIKSFHEIPNHISIMPDNLYRSLSWKVRELGHFHKTEVPYAEFMWGDAFRTATNNGLNINNFDTMIQKSIEAIQQKPNLFKNLPGYIG